MKVIRTLIATLLFIVGCYLCYRCFSDTFQPTLIAGALLLFCLAHFIFPTDRNKRDQDINIFDILEFLIEIPYQLITLPFRLIGRLFSSKSDIGL